MSGGTVGDDSQFPVSQEDFNASLEALFSPNQSVDTPKGMESVATAFTNLTLIYIHGLCKPLTKSVRFDWCAFELMIRRFHRDAFGVQKFQEFTGRLVENKKLNPNTKKEIDQMVSRLGLRITSEDPRKTKIAASFSLWMSTFRPVYFEEPGAVGVANDKLYGFCASLNFWLVKWYLKKFGTVDLGDQDSDIRLDRIKHDLTYRSLQHSSLEMLYSSMFKLTPEEAE